LLSTPRKINTKQLNDIKESIKKFGVVDNCIAYDKKLLVSSSSEVYGWSSLDVFKEEETMFWAIELYKSNYVKYVWKRMIIMASEDVGLAEDNLISQIMALKSSFDYLVSLKDKHHPQVLPFIQALLMMARAKKSRYVDLSYSVYWHKHHAYKSKHPIPDYALDMHTRRGKTLGRGMAFFYKVGAFINNANKVDREVEYEALAQSVDENPIEGLFDPPTAKKDLFS